MSIRIIKVGAHEILIDEADAPLICRHSWHVHKSNNSIYARTTIKGRHIKLHKLLLPGVALVDHKDSNGLNNCRDNLRPCNRLQNQWNARKISPATSRFKGVYKVKNRIHSFEVSVTCKRNRVKLGRFFDEIAAALAYDIAAVSLHGEFARPNFSIVEAALVHPESLKLAAERCRKKGIILDDLPIAA